MNNYFKQILVTWVFLSLIVANVGILSTQDDVAIRTRLHSLWLPDRWINDSIVSLIGGADSGQLTVPETLGVVQFDQGGIVRGDTTRKRLALIFTGGDFYDGGSFIQSLLKAKKIHASFCFTGGFYRNPENTTLLKQLAADGHYLGAHSDQHLLYCDWSKRDSLLVSHEQFVHDLFDNFAIMAKFDIKKEDARFFIPPYEWYNSTIAQWAKELGLVLFNFTPGTGSNADYTTPEMSNYKSSDWIYRHIIAFEQSHPAGLNGFLLLLHIGTHPDRTDKFYLHLPKLLDYLAQKNYELVRVDELLTGSVDD